MKNLVKLVLVFSVMALCVALGLAHFAPSQDHAHAVALGTKFVGGLMLGQRLMMPTHITTYDYDQLAVRLRPQSVNAPEANVDVLYDTQTYLLAGVSRLSFFVNVNSDPTLSNMELAGVLPANTFFDVYRVFVDANRTPTANTADDAVGAINDIAKILHAARSTYTFIQNTKPVGPVPLTFLGSSGSVEGMIGSGRAAAAGAVIQIGRMPDNGGWPVNGTIKLGPMSKFQVNLDFVSTAITADTPLRISFLGVRYRIIG